VPIAIPVRKNVQAKHLAAQSPDLTPKQIARAIGTHPGNVAKALAAKHFGRDRIKTRAR